MQSLANTPALLKIVIEDCDCHWKNCDCEICKEADRGPRYTKKTKKKQSVERGMEESGKRDEVCKKAERGPRFARKWRDEWDKEESNRGMRY